MAAPAGAVRACARGPSSRLSDSASIAVAASLSLASSSAPPTDRPTQHPLRFESSTTADFLGRGSSLSLSPPPSLPISYEQIDAGLAPSPAGPIAQLVRRPVERPCLVTAAAVPVAASPVEQLGCWVRFVGSSLDFRPAAAAGRA